MSSKTKTPTDTVIERDGFAEITLTRPRQVNGMETAVLRMREADLEKHLSGGEAEKKDPSVEKEREAALKRSRYGSSSGRACRPLR